VKKNTGCVLDAIVFDNGITVACWQTDIPEVAVYQNVEQFLSVRTPERGYNIIMDSGE
jgi:hypothetical protein